MDGFILINKEKNITSQGVCNKIKRKLNLKKVGHNGTLDPNAEGLMLIGLNNATKLLRLFDNDKKEYIAKIIFGYDSDTLDMDTNNIVESNMNVDFNKMLEAFEILKNQQTQTPPLTSAIKIDGKKLYEYQRNNIYVEIKERNVILYEYELLNHYYINNHFEIEIRLLVSKGYYIRSFARDLGKILGGSAIIHELKRTKMGIFSINDSKKIDEITKDDIKSIFDFVKLPIVDVKDYLRPLVLNGITLDERQTTINGIFYVRNNYDIIAIYEEVEFHKYKPILLFK